MNRSGLRVITSTAWVPIDPVDPRRTTLRCVTLPIFVHRPWQDRRMSAPATPQGSSTRLLVLGCVRIFQPVHGYFLRRELVSWEVDQWAHVHPGSIYNALKSLTRSGLLEEVGVVADGPRPPRTTYRLTDAGEDEFLTLVRAGLLTVDDPTLFLTAVNMAFALPRDEVVQAVADAGRRCWRTTSASLAAQIEQILGAKDTPDTATEVAAPDQRADPR